MNSKQALIDRIRESCGSLLSLAQDLEDGEITITQASEFMDTDFEALAELQEEITDLVCDGIQRLSLKRDREAQA